MTRNQPALPYRAGVTVLEVLFATGIAIFGLVGIASLLTVAGRQASDANESMEGHAYSQRWYNDFVVRGFNNTARWRWFNDQAPGFLRFDNLPNPFPRSTSAGVQRTPNRHAVCIDPAFFANFTTIETFGKNDFSNNQQRYRPGLFPYYQDNFDPTLALTGPEFNSSNAARLLRVSIGDVNSSSNFPMPAKLVERLFLSADDMSISIDEKDKTLPSQQLFRTLTVGTNPPQTVLASPLSKAEYSWFATLCPREFLPSWDETPSVHRPEGFYTLSVVVCHRRDLGFAYDPNTPQDIPQGERLFAVTAEAIPALPTQPSNFIGGSGGRVTFRASTFIEDTMTSGDWVMLSRHVPFTDPANGSGLATICRWYRIMTTDTESTLDASETQWSRTAILDGPDWVFDNAFPTQATLVENVIMVTERVISVD